jgi:hypothetical protein
LSLFPIANNVHIITHHITTPISFCITCPNFRRLHWRIRGGGRSSQRQNRHPAHWPVCLTLMSEGATTDPHRLNKTGCINPRYNVQLRDLEKWVVKLLPSRQFGYIVLTTSAGIVSTSTSRREAYILTGNRWIMRKPGGRRLLERFWASFTKRHCGADM